MFVCWWERSRNENNIDDIERGRMSGYGIRISAHIEGLVLDKSGDNSAILEEIRVEHIGANAGGFVDMRWVFMDVHCNVQRNGKQRSLAESEQRGEDI